MLRRASIAFLVLALGFAVACGRQVTPSPNLSGTLAGTVQIKYRVSGPFDFSQFNYWIVFNTSGQGGMPYAPAITQGNYKNFSYAFVVGAISGGNSSVLPILYQFYFIPATGQVHVQQFNVNPSTTTFEPNSNGQGTEFTLIFARSQLALPPPTAPTPTPTAAGTPTAKPSSTPTPTPMPSNASPGPTPVSSPTVASQSTWYVNLFTTDPANANHVLDALGLGPTDQSFTAGTFNVNAPEDIVFNQPAELNPPPNPASQLTGVEIINTP
jgi:hypothetical protein